MICRSPAVVRELLSGVKEHTHIDTDTDTHIVIRIRNYLVVHKITAYLTMDGFLDLMKHDVFLISKHCSDFLG